MAALGGTSSLESGLDLSDLRAEGWLVRVSRALTGGGVVVSLSHPFATTEQAGALLSDLAGTGPPANRPFRLELSRERSFWHVYSRLTGVVDLSCGLACFGDAGLKSALGSSTGVDPASLGAASTARAAEVFGFSFFATLPGRVHDSNASAEIPSSPTAPAVGAEPLTTRGSSDGRSTQQWDTALGTVTEINLVTQAWNTRSVTAVVVVSALGGVLLASLAVWVGVRRRRGRGERGGVPRHRAHHGRRRWFRRGRRGEAVTPVP